MRQRYADARMIPYPKYWRFAAAANRSVRHKPMIHGLFEVDVTTPRALLREHREKTGEALSFTAFIAACLAKAVDEHKAVQAIPRGRSHLMLFEDVDINTRIEREVAGEKYVVPYIIRAANHKTVRQMHDEIRAAQRADARTLTKRFQVFSILPTMLYGAFVWVFFQRRAVASAPVEADNGDGGHYVGGDVWNRGGLGHSRIRSDGADADGGRHRREAGGGGGRGARHAPGVPEPHHQRGPQSGGWRPRRALRPALGGTDRKRLWAE